MENPSPGFLAPLIAAGRRSNTLSPATIPGSTTPCNAAAHALQALMLHSSEGEVKWMLNEIFGYNVPVKRRCFPKETSKALREALDETLSLSFSLHKSSPLAMSAFALFGLYLPEIASTPPPGRLSGQLRGNCSLEKMPPDEGGED
jgi:hypothetical protein